MNCAIRTRAHPCRMHFPLCNLRWFAGYCYIAGASCWGFAQRHTTNGVLSLDSPFQRSVEWQQLARRTSPPKGLGRARSFPGYQPPLAQRLKRRPETRISRKLGCELAQPPGSRARRTWAAPSRSEIDDTRRAWRLPEIEPSFVQQTARFAQPPSRGPAASASIEPAAFSVQAQGVDRC